MFFLVCVCMCVYMICGCSCHSTNVEVRGQLCVISSLLKRTQSLGLNYKHLLQAETSCHEESFLFVPERIIVSHLRPPDALDY